MMIKIDYVRLAQALHTIEPLMGKARQQWRIDCKTVATALEQDNITGFDYKRFLDTCGLEPEEQ